LAGLRVRLRFEVPVPIRGMLSATFRAEGSTTSKNTGLGFIISLNKCKPVRAKKKLLTAAKIKTDNTLFILCLPGRFYYLEKTPGLSQGKIL
jgi:ribose 5-phosphate isomerase RpiB